MDHTRPHVVVVNDDPAQLELISHLIEQEPCDVYSFCRVTDALAHITESSGVDLIVTDLHMPGIDGWRFCHILRSTDFPSANETPILIVSATLSREDVGTVPDDIGADAFLSMPYTPQELRETVHKLLYEQILPTRPSVLIASRDLQDRKRVAEGFDSQGFRTFLAGDGRQALALFEQHHPGVVVLDHDPPGIAGLDLVSRFRADPRAVILVTTDGRSPELVIALTQQGADTHLTKPYEVDDLIVQVTRVRRGRAMLRVETTLETLTQQALRNARRIQRLNDCYLALGTDHDANIQLLTQATGELLTADVAVYDHHGLPTPYTLTYRSASGDTLRQEGGGRTRCLGLASPNDTEPVTVHSLQTSPYAKALLPWGASAGRSRHMSSARSGCRAATSARSASGIRPNMTLQPRI